MINKINNMKMKNLILLLIISVTTTIGFSQGQSDCDKARGFTAMYAQNKMWRDASNFFLEAYKLCGMEGLEQKDWNNARIIYKNLLKAEKDATKKAGLSDSLVWIFKNGDTYKENPKWKVEYASYLVKTKSTDTELIDGLYAKSIHELKDKNKTSDIQYYFTHLVRKFNNAEGDAKEEARGFALDEYLILSDYLSAGKANATTEKKKGYYTKTQNNLDTYFSQLAKDCDDITNVLGKKIVHLPTEKQAKIDAVKKYLNLLDKKNCTESELYGQFADSLLQLEPTAEAYYSQGNFYLKKKNYSKAKGYFEKAIEMEGNGENAGKYQYGLASAYYSSGSYKAAFNTAKGVQGEYRGNALKICGDAIARTANSCGDTSFERKANYWLANDYYKKAAAAGAKVSTSQYLNNAPTKEDVFDEGKSAGSSITLKCWGESTTIR
jgi:tetratricopeptide (TPR) repeat protein